MSGTLFGSTGTLRHRPDDPGRLTMEIDTGLAAYYRALIPRTIPTLSPRYAPHVTVVRPEKDDPIRSEDLSSYDGRLVEFFYSPAIQRAKIFFWLPVYCHALEAVRAELGLPLVNNTELTPPPGYVKPFHATIATLV